MLFLFMYYVYILKSVKFDKFYIGQTNDMVERLRRHNAGMEKFTSIYRPWKLVGYITKETRSEAMILETKLKNLNRQRLLSFIDKYLGIGGRDEA